MATAEAAVPTAAAAQLPSGPCFGDAPPDTLARDPRPRDLFATGTSVIWRSGDRVHVADPSGASKAVGVSSMMSIHAADGRAVFGTDDHFNLVAVDVASGQAHPVAPSSAFDMHATGRVVPGMMTLLGADYLLDGDYVYVAWHGDPAVHDFASSGTHIKNLRGRHEIGNLTRVKRDGSSPPEHLGVGPDGRFVIHDAFAYYGTRWQGLKRRRLARWPHTEMVWNAPDVEDMWVLGALGQDLLFGFTTGGSPPQLAVSIASMPFASTEDAGVIDPHVYVTSASLAFRGGLLAGHCVFTEGQGEVFRADLTDGTVTRIFQGHTVPGDATIVGSHLLAVDAEHLYYADYGGDRVVRWSR